MNACCPTCGRGLAGVSRLVFERRSGTITTPCGHARLRPSEFALVEILHDDAPSIHSVGELQAAVNLHGTTIRRLVHDIRLKVKPLGVDIANVRGVGYHLVGAVR
ncbi:MULTISPECIES: helix-turn-helix domain-containing protein [Phyllobacteriaceae]|jgi:DNA-binding response OmpR family regulator|uniref:helix-turn-helix domain-containing protein n=1 Tax=Phyllobacteriaceae TaxID=69277 RepID=UPI0013770B44|nr:MULTISPECIES: helix-turn-helix domain-containing protein [Mesorhizobium]MBN9232735.1 helix-turn-helix domain-containing protein [Mesorhizobium sp.]MDQ0330334.1 DNA-binding response OmpR family regulator [Mesorhizobium sp. YL-MeA3-2017]